MIPAVWRWLDRTWLGQRLHNIQATADAARAADLEHRALINNLKEILMSNLATLQNAVDRTGAAVATAVTALGDQREKIAALQETVNAGQLDQSQLQAMVASLDASSDAVAQALAPVVADDQVPTEEPVSGAPLDEPPAQNPDTADPADVDGSVPAGEPLPDV